MIGNIAVICIFGIFGCAIGSFLNVVSLRVPKHESFLFNRSRCPHCRKTLRWYELIPLVSFFWQGGKCRSCQNSISWRYPLVELATGAVFAVSASHVYQLIPLGAEAIYSIQFFANILPYLVIGSVLIVIFLTDLSFYLIPDKILFPAIGFVLLYNSAAYTFPFLYGISELGIVRGVTDNPFVGALYAALLASLFFLSLVIVSRGRWMGMGDVKFSFFMGLVLGFPSIFVALFLAFLSGSVFGILLIATGKKHMQSELPFGTFLSGATFIAIFFGHPLFSWYWNNLLYISF